VSHHFLTTVYADVGAGNGPSALILSYILHGHIPTYDPDHPHPDPILHEKLIKTTDLLSLDIDYLTEHFPASRFSYSTQALPVNVLLDTLIRPYGETEDGLTCVKWKHDTSRAVSHLVIGSTHCAGGQWVDDPVKASWDIGTLSYARMLSLPGYSFDDHYHHRHGHSLPFASRPTRRQVADYFAAYPMKVGISDSILNGLSLSGLSRQTGGFHVSSHDLTCKYLVIASGIFTDLIAARPLLQPLTKLPYSPEAVRDLPLLVVGSGFSAADVIISTPACQKIIHIFKWSPEKHPSPLRGCHQHAYPEYAGVYRRMKVAAPSSDTSRDRRPKARRRSSTFDMSRDWGSNYEGFPNTEIVDVQSEGDIATVTLRNGAGNTVKRRVSGLAYVVGRRGNMDFLEADFQQELGLSKGELISGQTFRHAAQEDLEVAENVFIIGSLTGDSLIRFSYGSCTYTAGKMMKRAEMGFRNGDLCDLNGNLPTPRQAARSSFIAPMKGFDGHGSPIEVNCSLWIGGRV
jgi:hypothetical protein